MHGPLAIVAALEIVALLVLSGYGGAALAAKVARDVGGFAPRDPIRALTNLVFFRNWAYEGWLESRRFSLADAVLLASIAATVALAWAERRRLRAVAFLATVGIAPVVVLATLPIRSYTRLLSPSLPFLVALLAVGAWLLVQRARWRWLLVPVAGVWIWMLAPRVLDVYRLEIEPWKSVCRAVAATEQPAGVLLNEPFMRAPFDVCYRGPYPVRTFPRGRRLDPEWIRSFVRDKRVVWVVYSHAWRSDPRRQALGIVKSAGFRLRKTRHHGRLIDTYLFLRHRLPRRPTKR